MSIKLDALEASAVRLALKRPGITRAGLAHKLGAGSPTVAALVKRLLCAEVLVANGATSSTGGRPAAKLFVSDRIGYCCSHQVILGRLTSHAMSIAGATFAKVDRPVKDIPSMLRGVGAAELELSVKAGDRPLLASAIIVPGIVDRETNTGEAPWLYGKELIHPRPVAPQSYLISAAASLMRSEESSHRASDGTWLALDLANGLSALFLTRKGEPVPLDLAHLEPNAAIILGQAFDEAVLQAAGKRSSLLSKELTAASPVDSLANAIIGNDHIACALVDTLVAETLGFIRTAVRSLRPDRLILSSLLLDPALDLTETIRRDLVRQAGVNQSSIVLVSPQEAIEQRFAGACAAALDLRLGEIEKHGGELKVE